MCTMYYNHSSGREIAKPVTVWEKRINEVRYRIVVVYNELEGKVIVESCSQKASMGEDIWNTVNFEKGMPAGFLEELVKFGIRNENIFKVS